jgi:thiol-disulfide isomerase/thioredoxin
LVNLIVDPHGVPQNVHVLRGLGMGLDEKAVEAVRQYRFKPAMEHGKPVAVEMNAEVNFGSGKSEAATPAQDGAARAQAVAALGAAPTPAPARKIAHVLSLQLGAPVVETPVSATRTLDYEPGPNSSQPAATHMEERFFRDSAGRTRSEFTYPDRQPAVDIVDTVAHRHCHWTVGDTEAQCYPLKDYGAPVPKPITAPPGAQDIEGFPTRHGRQSTTGKDGVQRSIESWYAPDLALTLLTITDELGLGRTTVRYSHIERTEPQPSLFQVPLELAMEDAATPPASIPAAEPAAHPVAAEGTTPNTSADASERPATQAHLDDPKFQKALVEARDNRQPIEEQLTRWKNANKAAKEGCAECLRRIVVLSAGQSQWKDVVDAATQLESVSTDPRDKYLANFQRGQALLHTHGDNPKPEQVTEADTSFRAALALSPDALTAIYSEGRVLAMLGREADARAMFAKYLEVAGSSDRYRTRAQHFVDNPGLAALRMAPPFTLTTSEGQQISLDDMGGKVVLLDFWATWCGPCRQTLPEIQQIAAKFADQPLVVISISSDKDANAWTRFVANNQMTWPQYRDADGALNRAYGVSSIPRFFTIDTDGALQSVQIGSGSNVEGEVRKLLNKARDAEKKRATRSDRATAGG